MSRKTYRGIRPDDLHGRMALANPERGFRTEMYFSEIPGELVERTGNENVYANHKFEYQPQQKFDPFAKKKPVTKSTTNKYSVGNTVFHKVFGTGMVLTATPMGNDTMLEIAFDKVGTKTLMANFAKMEIIK